jgi:hypothetical protein
MASKARRAKGEFAMSELSESLEVADADGRAAEANGHAGKAGMASRRHRKRCRGRAS